MDGGGIMKQGSVTIQILEADEGKILTNGEIFSTVVYLGVNDSSENWKEITEEEAVEIGYTNEDIRLV